MTYNGPKDVRRLTSLVSKLPRPIFQELYTKEPPNAQKLDERREYEFKTHKGRLKFHKGRYRVDGG